MIDSVYFNQAELLLRILPFIDREAAFAMKGETAINFFARDLPRISVDIDLVYLPVGERDESLREISAALVRISHDIENRIPGTKVIPRKTGGSGLLSGLFVQRLGYDRQNRTESGHKRICISACEKTHLSQSH